MEILEKMIDEKRRGGKRRREILQYLANYPRTTPYQITKAIYQNVQAGYKIAKKHLGDFEKRGILKVEKEGRISHYSLTDRGRMLCKTVGLILPSNRAEEIITGLNRYVREPLSNGDIKTLRALLSEDVVNTVEKIFKNFKWRKPVYYWPKLKPSSKRMEKLFGPFSKSIDALEKKALEKMKIERIEIPNLPLAFITSMAVLRWEFRFGDAQRKAINICEKILKNAAKQYAQQHKISKKDAENEILRIYLKQQSGLPTPHLNYFVWRDFEKISCGYYLILGNRKLGDNFIKLESWLVDSFFKKSDPIVLSYIQMVQDELFEQMKHYGQVWAFYELSKHGAPPSRGEREKAKGGEKA